jgi:predicted Zn finger-like uncharacterized protein
MYTQCPECDVAFRVTAQVLKQAAGKVRCGGCGVAFNALAYLSEENPAASRPSADRPEGGAMSLEEPGEIEAGPPPKTISAAQSAALLKTLDQLAGEDIRIEDTGVEWRVLDPAEDPYDDFEPDPSPTIAQEPMRFDDNTPLPDDFDADDLSVAAPEPAVIAEPARSPDESQIDLVFGEPGEWQDLLGAVEEPVDVSGIEVLEEVGDDPVEASLDEDIEPVAEPEPEEQPLDMDTQFAIQAEAMGIDLSGMQQRLEEPDKADTSIDEDLMAAAFETEASAKVEAIDEPEPEEPLESELLETEPLESEILAEPEPLMEPEDMMGSGPEEDLAAALVFALEEMVDDEIEFDSELTDFDEPDVLEVPETLPTDRT